MLQIREGEFCWFTWLDDGYNFVSPTGTGMWSAQYYNGQVQWNCHTVLNFDDPGIASLDQACSFLDELGLDLCNGNGSFVHTTSYAPAPLACYWEDAQGNVYLADRAIIIVSPNGNVNISCHFDLSP